MDCNKNTSNTMKDDEENTPGPSALSIQVTLEDRRKVFVQEFVDCFEKYYNEYYKRLKEKTSKAGKWADLVCKLLEGNKPETPSLINTNPFVPTNIIVTVIRAAGNKYNRHELKKNTKKLYEYKENPEKVREILEEGAELIFTQFESTFEDLTCDGSAHRAMEKLAHDAVERIINFYKNNPHETWSTENMKNGATCGNSKRRYFSQGKTVRDGNGRKIKTNFVLRQQAVSDSASTKESKVLHLEHLKSGCTEMRNIESNHISNSNEKTEEYNNIKEINSQQRRSKLNEMLSFSSASKMNSI